MHTHPCLPACLALSLCGPAFTQCPDQNTSPAPVAVPPPPRSCTEPGVIDQADLADSPPLEFVAGVAQDLQIPDERAISMATNWVAGHCRSRIVEVRRGRGGLGVKIGFRVWETLSPNLKVA